MIRHIYEIYIKRYSNLFLIDNRFFNDNNNNYVNKRKRANFYNNRLL